MIDQIKDIAKELRHRLFCGGNVSNLRDKMKKAWDLILGIVDVVISPLVFLASFLLLIIRKIGVTHFPTAKFIFMKLGVYPIVNYYYEPWFGATRLKYPADEARRLPGIDWNLKEQLKTLHEFKYQNELHNIPEGKTNKLEYYFGNGSFESGDSEYWYNLIRLKKPRRIVEIGSGNSTLMARKAIKRNMLENPRYKCKHICIEPYEMPWLDKLGVKVIREKVENIRLSVFNDLEKDDILFIDSTHMIKPQGDVLREYLTILPSLKRGVIVHIHDIFTPYDYLKEWLSGDVKFWNEQYLLEAFLTNNHDWKIVGALNFLHHTYFDKLKQKCPYLTSDREPGSFYIQKIA